MKQQNQKRLKKEKLSMVLVAHPTSPKTEMTKKKFGSHGLKKIRRD